MDKPDPEFCGALTGTESGEAVTPCHKLKGHEGPHEGFCLGSRAIWTDEPGDPEEVLRG